MADNKTQKRKRFSKNKKKYWKKHADITEVEDFLEEQRLEERTGGNFAEKPDEQLFFVDCATKPQEEGVQRKKRKREAKPLRCHAALLPDPHIKPIRIPHNVKRKESSGKDVEPVKVTKSLLEKKAMRKDAIERRSTRLKEKFIPDAEYDLWGQVESETGANKHYLRIMKKLPKKPPPKFSEKPSIVPAVEISHPGASYNPTYEDHQELLTKALDKEVKKEKEEKRLKRALDEAFPDQKSAPTEEDRQKELAEGLFDESESESESGISEDEDRLSLNPPVRREDKKTEKQRSKEKKVKDEQDKAKLDKEDRIKKNEIFRIKSMKKDVLTLLQKQQGRRKRKEERVAANVGKPKRLGKKKFEAADLEVKLSDEMEGSLRLLKPEGHLLEDRFKSLQKRNILEPRGRAQIKRKYKRKKFEKKSHKNFA